ncbi:hypothetical protein PHISCL_08238, partial [Aspergillus sclerotialis]
MSAPQIPNLNTLRRGGGRGRLRGRGGASAGSDGHGSLNSGKDRVVQGTDNDASVSRLSAVNLGYLDDPFARALTPLGLETRRLPIINRGTYVRSIAIDALVSRFLEPSIHQDKTKKQIISLGAGSDTRVFRLLASRQNRQLDFIYHEIDFPVNTAAKVKAIRSTPLLQQTLGIERSEEVTISEAGDELHSPSYHIHPLDLRNLARGTSPEEQVGYLKEVDTNIPTLLISECCLVYLSPSEADGVVDYFTRKLFPPTPVVDADETESKTTPETTSTIPTPLGLIIYEPIRPEDPFGRTMISNLATRGIHLQTVHKYASLDTQQKRLRDHGFETGQSAADVDFLWERW